MATDKSFVEYVADQMALAGVIRFRAMFGEYGIYCDEQIVGLICDNKVFLKPTRAGREFIGKVTEAPAYPGAKPGFLIGDAIDDRNWFGKLVRLTADELISSAGKKAPRVAVKGKSKRSTAINERSTGKKRKKK